MLRKRSRTSAATSWPPPGGLFFGKALLPTGVADLKKNEQDTTKFGKELDLKGRRVLNASRPADEVRLSEGSTGKFGRFVQ
jgi:hypothetical protein